MYYLIVIGILLLIYWLYWVIRMRNPYLSVLYIGKKGSGKSTLITKLVLKFHNSKLLYYDDDKKKWIRTKWNIYTNTEVFMPFYVNKFDIRKLGSFVPKPNSIIICDEINLVWDNRNFKSFSPDIQEFFRLARKLRCKVIMFSQSFDCDKKIRTLVDQMWLLQSFLGVFSYGKKISKVIDIKEAALSADSQIVDTLKFQSILVPHSRQFTFIPKYIKYFNSYENMTNKPYFNDEFWPLIKKKYKKGFSRPFLKRPKKRKEAPAANGELTERKILDFSNVPGQYRKESSMDSKTSSNTFTIRSQSLS